MPSEPLRSVNSPCNLMPCALREILLLELELRCQVEQPDFLFLFGDDFIKEGQVIAEEADA